MRKPIFFILSLLILLSLACNIRVPMENIKTGDLQKEEIMIPVPSDAEDLELEINFGAGELTINPGNEDNFVSGTATYNVDQFKPEIDVTDNMVTMNSGKIEGFPNIKGNLRNEWDLALGTMPFELRIFAGAYKGRYDLGGLAIEKLAVHDGASDVKLEFSEPNLVEMSVLSYETGASSVTLSDLGNANFANLEFSGGAGEYTLDFSGAMQRDADVTIKAGISSVKLIVPENVNVKLSFEGGLSNISARDNWQQNGSRYTLTSDSANSPTLTISVDLGAGELVLENP